MPLDQPDEHDPSYDPDHYRANDDRLHRPNDHTMPLGDHIEELRSRLVKMLIGVVIALVVTVIYSFQIIGWLAQPLLQVQELLGVPAQPVQTDPTAGFTSVYMPVVLIAAIILSAPWILWQAWQFIVVGLYAHEKKVAIILAPFSTIMTGLGVLFTYYILLPVSLAFFLNFVSYYPEIDLNNEPNALTRAMLNPYIDDKVFTLPTDFVFDTEPMKIPVLKASPENPAEGDLWINNRRGRVELFFAGQTRVLAERSTTLITPLPAMNEYVRFASIMMLGIVAAFQLPVLMLVLGWTQLFDPRGIASLRKYAFFGACVLGAVLTPADPLSMIVLAVPLYLLFEFGLFLMNVSFKKAGDALPDET